MAALTRALALVLTLSTVGSSAAWAADPTGTWLTANGRSRVRVVNCGGGLCGSIIWLKEPNDPATGQPKTDKNNSDASQRSRPLIGVQIILGMTPSGTPGKWSGQVYNAEDGKTYSGSFTLQDSGSAQLEGCALGGLICKAQVWTRTN